MWPWSRDDTVCATQCGPQTGSSHHLAVCCRRSACSLYLRHRVAQRRLSRGTPRRWSSWIRSSGTTARPGSHCHLHARDCTCAHAQARAHVHVASPKLNWCLRARARPNAARVPVVEFVADSRQRMGKIAEVPWLLALQVVVVDASALRQFPPRRRRTCPRPPVGQRPTARAGFGAAQPRALPLRRTYGLVVHDVGRLGRGCRRRRGLP